MENNKTNQKNNDRMKGKYLTFLIDNEYYGIAIRHIMEIIEMQEITQVPQTGGALKGIINLRGMVLPLIDMRVKLSKAEKKPDEETCIIVIHSSELSVGLVIDSVEEVYAIPDEKIFAAPEVASDFGKRQFVDQVAQKGEQLILLIDPHRMVSDQEKSMFNQITASKN